MRLRAFISFCVLAALAVVPARADRVVSGFEAPTYSVGSVHGQDGWVVVGRNRGYDQAVVGVNTPIAGWGAQAFRMSNNFATPDFDQPTSKPTADEAGEADARNDGFSGGTRRPRFEARWEFTSAAPDEWQPGLSIDVSPDRGDGARMGVLRMSDELAGVRVSWIGYVASAASGGCSSSKFITTELISGLDRSDVHKIRLSMDLIDGPANDIVRIYVNDVLRGTVTTWEDFFRECQPPASRTVDSLMFRAAGTRCAATCAGRGFLFDNVSSHSIGAITDTAGGVEVTEGGAPDTYTVKLDGEPQDVVRVDVFPGTGVTVSPRILFFNPSNYSVPQVVTVTAVDDADPEVSTIVNVNHNLTSSDPTWNGAITEPVPVTVHDNDGVFVVRPSAGSTVVSEWGITDTYQMRLLSPPTADVTITATPDAQLGVSPGSLTFTPLNWNVAQSITVSAIDDAAIEGDHVGVITHAASSADLSYDGRPVPSVPVTILDNDPPTVPTAPSITCVGATTAKTHRLTGTAQPGTIVEVYLNGVFHGSARTRADGSWEVLVAFSSSGPNTLTARAISGSNVAGPFGSGCVIDVSADFVAPAAPTITTPDDNAFQPSSTFVSGSAPGDAIRVRLYDFGVEITQIPTGSGGAWSQTRQFANGQHKLTARAEDAAGNLSVPSAVRTFTADGEAPAVKIYAPPGSISLVQPVLPFEAYRLRGNASDVFSGVDHLEAEYENLLTGEVTTTTPSCSGCPSAAGTVTWTDSPSLMPGIYEVVVRAVDAVGNIGSDSRFILFIE